MILINSFLLLVLISMFIYNRVYFFLLERKLASDLIKQEQRYSLFESRDELVDLVIDEKLPEKSKFFQTYYQQINFLIGNIQLLDLKHLYHAVKNISYKNKNLIEKDLAYIKKELDSYDPVVKIAADKLFNTLLNITLYNTNRIRLFVILCNFVKGHVSERIKNIILKEYPSITCMLNTESEIIFQKNALLA